MAGRTIHPPLRAFSLPNLAEEDKMRMHKPHDKNWQPYALIGLLLAGLILVFVLKLSYYWLFIIFMIACHLGHMGGKQHH